MSQPEAKKSSVVLDDGKLPEGDEELSSFLREQAHSDERLNTLANYFSAVSNKTRLRMLYVTHRYGERCVCDLADVFEITQPAVSRHLKILREKNLVETRRDAQTIYYSLRTDNPFAGLLASFFGEKTSPQVTLDMQLKELA